MNRNALPSKVVCSNKQAENLKLIVLVPDQLLAMCKEYQARICAIESDKYDTEKEVEFKDYMVSNSSVTHASFAADWFILI